MVTKISELLFVTTPSRNITFWSSNCPIMLASVRKSKRFLSVAPGFNVFIATDISGFTGLRSFPLQTSPNSPKIYIYIFGNRMITTKIYLLVNIPYIAMKIWNSIMKDSKSSINETMGGKKNEF